MWSMVGNSITMTGVLAHPYFLLPDLWVCKPCTILWSAIYETALFKNGDVITRLTPEGSINLKNS